MSASAWGAAGLPACPISLRDYPRVTLAHGAGGRLSAELVERMFVATLGGESLRARHDGARVRVGGRGDVVITTDTYVVSPLRFPGGDIGTLAVYGTTNDLAMCGARPRALSLGLVLEEGLPMDTLWRQVLAIRAACELVGVEVVTGDTKVVERGKGDGMFVNTTGVGAPVDAPAPRPARVRPGDAIIVTGDLGRHGIAVLAAREQLMIETPIESDLATLVEPALALLEGGVDVRCLRDLTRGGLASALNELAASAGVRVELDEERVAVHPTVRGVCELLGFDPLYVANEGRFVAIVAPEHVDAALELLRRFPVTAEAVAVGRVLERGPAEVVGRSAYGTTRVVDMLSGAQLPRIC